jgi:hypothetical protein
MHGTFKYFPKLYYFSFTIIMDMETSVAERHIVCICSWARHWEGKYVEM